MRISGELEDQLNGYFQGDDTARKLFDAVQATIASLSECSLRVTKTQIAFRHRRVFAWVWIPGRALGRPAAPLVLTVALRRRDGSPRWKEIVEPYPGRFTHHLELFTIGEVDEEVTGWLQEAFITAI